MKLELVKRTFAEATAVMDALPEGDAYCVVGVKADVVFFVKGIDHEPNGEDLSAVLSEIMGSMQSMIDAGEDAENLAKEFGGMQLLVYERKSKVLH